MSDTTQELTAGDVYDSLCEQVASARTRALIGEIAEATRLYMQACETYERFRPVLTHLPLHALEHDFNVTREILSQKRVTGQFSQQKTISKRRKARLGK